MRAIIFFFLIISFSCESQMIMNVQTLRATGARDATPPQITITTDASSNVVGTAGVTAITATIMTNKAVTGLVVSDITTSNCSLSGFVAVNASLYTVSVIATANGVFNISIPASTCQDLGGNLNAQSNTLTRTFTDASSYTYDLEHAPLIQKAQHYRGHVASFSESSERITPGYEMFCSRNNIGGSEFYRASVQSVVDAYNFGRHSIGIYAQQSTYADAYSLITAAKGGVPPTTGAYSTGVDFWKLETLPYTLSMRNTQWEDRGTKEYRYGSGLTDIDWCSRGSTISFANYCIQQDGTNPGYNFIAGTNAEGYAKLTTILPEVINASGFYSNFMHASWYYGDYAKDYFQWLDDHLAPYDVFRGSQQDIIEYYWVRESISSVVGLGSQITVNYSKLYPGSPYQNITAPAWIKVDLTGTIYDGVNITTSHGGRIRSMGNNVYCISVPLNYATTSVSFNIYIAPTADYINLTKPVVNRSGNSVTSDQPCKFSLFKKPKTTTYEKDVTIASADRKLTFVTSWTIPGTINTSTTDYYLGYINAEGVSGMIQF